MLDTMTTLTDISALREEAQTATDRASMSAVATECEIRIGELQKARDQMTQHLGALDLAQAQLRAEMMRLRDRLKGQGTSPPAPPRIEEEPDDLPGDVSDLPS